MLPDWAPSIHPLLVHFPIALLVTAVVLDGVGLLLRKVPGLRMAAVLIYTLGALGALASFFTGRMAADLVAPSGAANAVLTDHADWAEWTVWFFGIYALLRLGLLWVDRKGRMPAWVSGVFFIVGAGGLFLVWETAEHGAQMVFEYGVGVQAVASLEDQLQARQLEIDRSNALAAGPVASEAGSWQWIPNEHAAASLNEAFRWLEGDTTRLVPAAVAREDKGYTLRLEARGGASFFVFDQPLSSLQADVTLNVDGFEGTLMLVYHVRDANTYQFLALADGMMQQGRVVNGAKEVMDEKPFEGSRWQQIRVVADQTHFRGYAGGTLVTHGHGEASAPGPVGLRIDGTGTILLDRMAVQALRSP